MLVAAVDRSAFESGQRRGTDATKSRIRRHIIESDLPGVRDTTHREDFAAILNRDKQCVARPDPRFEYFGRLVAQPSFENDRVIAVIGDTELRDRPSA
jgi:hypothetical protein